MARLGDHPNIVTVYDAVQDGDVLHIVARYMAGGSLAERLAAAPGGRLPGRRGAAHRPLARRRARPRPRARRRAPRRQARQRLARRRRQRGAGRLRHRRGGRRPGRAGSATGTPYYQAPEQAAGDARAARSPTSTRSGRRCGSCCAAARRSPAPTRSRCSRSTATPSPSRRRATPAGIPPGLDALVLVAARQARRRTGRRDAAAVRDALDRLGGAPSVPVAAVAADREPLVGRDDRARGAAPRARRGRAPAAPASSRSAASPGSARRGSSTRPPPRPARAAPPSCAGAPTRSRARTGRGARALRPLVAAASGLPARVLDDVRRLTGDGRPPEVPAAARRRVRRRGGAAADVRRGRRAGPRRGARAAAVRRARGRPRRRPLVARAARATCSRPRRTRSCCSSSPTAPPTSAPATRWPAMLEALERDRRLTRVALHGLPEAAVVRFLPPDVPSRARARCARCTSGPPATRSSCASSCALLAERDALHGERRGGELPALVPDRVREVVGRRLEPLDPATREVLAIAGVVGRPFTIAGVARVGGLGREVGRPGAGARAGRAARGGRAPTRPGPFGFAHAIVRDAVYDELPPALRARLHASVAAMLQESLEAGGEATAAEAAYHALSAARSRRRSAARLGPLARGGARGRRAAGARRGRRALRRRAGGARARRRGRRRRAAGDAARARVGLVRRRRHRGGPAALPRGRAAAARRSGAADVQARAAIGFSEVQQYGAIDEDAIALLQGALDALPPDDSALRARASGLLGLRLDPVTDQARREALLDEGVAMARRLGDSRALVTLLSAAALVNWPPERAAVAGGRRRRRDRARRPRRRHRAGLLGAHDASCATRSRPDGPARSTRSSSGSRGSPPTAAARTTAGACSCCRRRGRCSPAASPTASGWPRRPSRSTACTATTPTRSTPCSGLRSRCSAGARRTRRWRRCATTPAATGRCRCGRRCSRRRSTACARTAPAAASRRATRDGFAGLLRTPDWLCGLALLAEPVAAAGTPEQVERLIEALAPHADRNAVMDDAWAAFGPVARPLGVLAAAAGRAGRGRAPLRARRRAGRAPGARRAGSWRRSPTGCARRARAWRAARPRARARARPGAAVGRRRARPRARRGPVRRRRRSSRRSPGRDSPPSRACSRRRPSPRPQLSAR